MSEATGSTKYDTEFFAAIGRLAVSWARIECGIDFAVQVIHHHQGGAEVVEPEAPWSLDRKLKYLRRAFNKIEEFNAAKDIIGSLTDDIRVASERRQDMLHGFVLHNQDGATGIRMARLLRGGEPFANKRFEVTTDEINKWANEASLLGTRANDIGAAFAKAHLEQGQ